MTDKKEKLPKSAIIWRGASLFTGRPIQVVLTGIDLKTANEKTGAMVQASIVRQEGNPTYDYGTVRERDICGDCPLSGPYETRACYVRFLAFRLGEHTHAYPQISLDDAARAVEEKPVRIGAFGDPAAVPYEVWAVLLSRVHTWTGYTHAWRTCDDRFKRIVMASVETRGGARLAHARGWRTFRVKRPDFDAYLGEIVCPATMHKVQCVKCGLCSGALYRASNIVIDAHGSGANNLLRITQREFNL